MNYDAILNRKKVKGTIKYPDIKLDLLTENQIDSLAEEVDGIFDRIGLGARITDYAVALGGNAIENQFKDLNGYWYTKDKSAVYSKNICYSSNNMSYSYGIRPFLYYDVINFYLKDNDDFIYRDNDDLIEFGEYPQMSCTIGLSERLEDLYKNNKLTRTGKCYTIDSMYYNESDEDFKAQKHIEYEYDGNKYVRVQVNLCSSMGCRAIFSNNHIYENGDYIWVHVSPVKWIVSHDIVLTEKIIVAGIRFSYLEKYINEFLSKEILTLELLKENSKSSINMIKQKKFENLSDALKSAKEEMNKIMEDVEDMSYQKIKK